MLRIENVARDFVGAIRHAGLSDPRHTLGAGKRGAFGLAEETAAFLPGLHQRELLDLHPFLAAIDTAQRLGPIGSDLVCNRASWSLF